MKKALLLVLAALVLPSAALAAKPEHGPKRPRQVTYELSGTLSNYTAYDNSIYGPTNGTITILVKHSNSHGKALRGQSLTFPVDAKTKISLRHHLTAITNGDNGIVRIRAARKIAPADLVATLQLSPAKLIVDRGAPKPKH